MIEELGKQILNWFLGGFSLTFVVAIAIFILFTLGVVKIAQKFLVQGLLLLVVWLPGIIVANATDYSQLQPPPPVPLSGASLILFPYVWDTVYGYFGGVYYLAMIAVSYVALLHMSMLFCHSYGYSIFWSPIIAYLCLVALGLGLINTHKFLLSSYVNACVSQGIHPVIPIVFFATLLLIIIALKFRKVTK